MYASERNLSSKLDIVYSEFHKLGSGKEGIVDRLALEGSAAAPGQRAESFRKLALCLYNEATKELIRSNKKRGFVRDAGQKKFMRHVNRGSQLKEQASSEQSQLMDFCSSALDVRLRYQNKLYFQLLAGLPDSASKVRPLNFFLAAQQRSLEGPAGSPCVLLSSKYLLAEVWDSLGLIYCNVDFPS